MNQNEPPWCRSWQQYRFAAKNRDFLSRRLLRLILQQGRWVMPAWQYHSRLIILLCSRIWRIEGENEDLSDPTRFHPLKPSAAFSVESINIYYFSWSQLSSIRNLNKKRKRILENFCHLSHRISLIWVGVKKHLFKTKIAWMECKWGSSHSQGHFIGYRQTLALDSRSLQTVCFFSPGISS